VLLFLVHYRIPLKKTSLNNYRTPNKMLASLPEVKEEGYRRPTTEEAAEYFNITNPSSVRTWWATRATIFGKVNFTKNYLLKWPALEKELVKQFQAARASNKIVTIHWFGRISHQIWQRLYPNAPNVFVFSNGWFWRFLKRQNIVRRRITKMATKPPEKVVKVTNAFIQYIRKRSRRKDAYQTTVLRSSPPFDSHNWKTDSL
jgi:hypothetical protein